jgi:uridine kinase
MSYSYHVILEQSIPIIKAMGNRNSPVFIPVSGPDAVGKTELAKKLRKGLNDALIFTTDHYLNNSREDRLRAAKEGKSGYWLEMHHVELLFSDLGKLKVGMPVMKRVYDTAHGTTLELTREYLEPAKYVIVDSGLSLTDAFWAVYPPERFGIFISADEKTRRILKNRRDRKERNYERLYKKYGNELVELFIQRNLEDCKAIVMPTASRANLVAEIDKDFNVLSIRIFDRHATWAR